MNKIEREMYAAIDKSREDGGFFQIYCKPASEKTYSILEKHCIGFGEFLGKYPDKNRNYKGEVLHAESKYDGAETTEQLFKLYIEKL